MLSLFYRSSAMILLIGRVGRNEHRIEDQILVEHRHQIVAKNTQTFFRVSGETEHRIFDLLIGRSPLQRRDQKFVHLRVVIVDRFANFGGNLFEDRLKITLIIIACTLITYKHTAFERFSS